MFVFVSVFFVASVRLFVEVFVCLFVDGTIIDNAYAIIYSKGQRACPGEKWTRSLIYLYITNVLKHFTLKFPDGAPVPDLDGHPGINHAPHEFKICAVPR